MISIDMLPTVPFLLLKTNINNFIPTLDMINVSIAELQSLFLDGFLKIQMFSIRKIIKNEETREVLLTLAYVFEVSTSEHGAQHVIYRLVNK